MSELFQVKILEAAEKIAEALQGIQAELMEANEYLFEIADAQYCEEESDEEAPQEPLKAV
jgi:hypothetical protein